MRFRTAGGAAVAAAALLALSACTSATPGTAATGAPHTGAYPVAIADRQVSATPAVSAGGYALVAAGDPVKVHLHDADLLVAAAGPDLDVPEPAPGQPITARTAPGVLTVTVTATRGSAAIRSSQFLGLDEKQTGFAIRSDRTDGTVSPGHPVVLHLHSTFASGHTTLTWQPLGHPLVTWDFTVEID